MQEQLKKFRALQIDKTQLRKLIGDDLHNVACAAIPVRRSHVIHAIETVKSGEITVEHLVEWVNVIWFTDLFFFFDGEQLDTYFVDQKADNIKNNIFILSHIDILDTMEKKIK